MNRLTIIIPARYGSTRFPGKPLVNICGRPMIQHVYEKARMARLADNVIIATDDERIAKAAKAFDGLAILTSPHHETGTDRVVEVASHLDCPWIINLQGDEPLIEPEVIDLLARSMFESDGDVMFSLMRPVKEGAEFINPNMVKVVPDNRGYALYFSRAPIPFPKGGLTGCMAPSAVNNAYIHYGIYGFRRDFLLSIPLMASSMLEKVEGLEQLRILASGFKIKMVVTEYQSIGVDTPEDVKRVERLMNAS